MTQKQFEERLNATEADTGAIKQDIQRISTFEKTMEKMHVMLSAMYEDQQRLQTT